MAEPTTSNFPTSLDDSVSLSADVVNQRQFTLDTGTDNVVTTISVSESIASTSVPCYLYIAGELIYAQNKSSGDFTNCVRGADGTTAASHTVGTSVNVVYAANLFNQLKRAIIAIETALGAGLAGIHNTAEIDFGAIPTYSKSFTVTDAGVTSSKIIIPSQSAAAATGKSQDENEMDALILRAVAGSGSFTLYAEAKPGPVTGKFKINYIFV